MKRQVLFSLLVIASVSRISGLPMSWQPVIRVSCTEYVRYDDDASVGTRSDGSVLVQVLHSYAHKVCANCTEHVWTFGGLSVEPAQLLVLAS